MRLTRLQLSGFKSFADTIDLPFDDGMTCIVGPNGCGKSNVSDAVRWVLGEQRARMLRGSRMDDVIFQGSIKRSPLSIAEVALHFDNADGTLPIAFQEVVVTRRLSRSGQSEYLVNQSPARLKDVQDLLRGTGLGSDAGVVIEARMIDRLLSDRAEERRSLFEEAAGIGLYRDRKGITERRLEKTRDDLQRLDDVITEVGTQVRSLARQRGKADRHRSFTSERFAIVMELARRNLARFDETARETRRRREEIGVELPRARERATEHERLREAAVQARATAEAQRTEVERRLADRRIQIEKLDGDLKLARERLQNTASRKARARDERRQQESAAAQAALERDAAAEEWQAAKAARESVQIELDLRTASEGEARTRLADQRTRVREIEDRLQETAEAARALQGEQAALDAELQDLRNQATEAARRLQEATETRAATRERAAAAEVRLAAADREAREAATELDRSQHALAAAGEEEAAVTVERRAAAEAVTQHGARRDALEALERDRAGLAPAAKLLLEARDRFPEGTILGPLSDFVTTTPENAATVERMLTEWLHAVVVRDGDVVREIIRWHEERRPGPLVLLPLFPGPRPSAPGFGQAPSIDVAAPATDWAHALLRGHQPLEGGSGAITRPNGAVFLPGTDQPAGPLARRAELDAVAHRLARAQDAMERLEVAAQEAAARHAAAKQAVDAAQGRAETTRRALQEAKGAGDDASREAQRAERDTAEAAETVARIDQRIAERSERAERVTAQLREAVTSRSNLEADLASQRSRLTGMEAEQESARERRVHWQVEEAQVSAREDAAAERKSRAEAALAKATEELARLDRELKEIESSTSDVAERQARWSEELAEARTQASQLGDAAGEAERAVERATQATATRESELEAARHQVQELGERLHQSELEDTEQRGKRQALVERLEVEWHRPVDELLETAEPVEGDAETLEEENRRLAAAIEAIGPVNPLAAQEYEEEKTRLEFLQTQREDLAEARSSLETSLKEIDRTARALFEETFAAIREHFQHVFHTLFEGGDCDVRLAEGDDPLESDIEIRAAPRGKRTQRIHLLSSGERALVALSLLFAIYLAKPSPFCLLDEVDAPLDDANVQRFIRLLMEFKADTQFIVITHNPRTMQVADAVYGVTMQEPGVSSIVGVRLGEHAGV